MVCFYRKVLTHFENPYDCDFSLIKRSDKLRVNLTVMLLDFHVLQVMLKLSIFTDNLCLKKVASRAHSYADFTYYNASNAVDGNTETCIRTDPIGLTDPEETVWWKVDRGREYSIYSINILFKSYKNYGL